MAHVHGAGGAAKTMASAMAGAAKMSGAMPHSAMGGVAATAGRGTLKKILSHPVALIGFGFALAYLACQYRKDIISERAEE